jgi:hypothetical protein
MARRKRKDDEPEWVAPEFDEVAYMRTEIEAARTAVITIGWALLGALISFLLYSVNAVLAFFGGIGVGFGLYFMLPLIGISVTPFKRKDWIGHGITYFFSWLAFWILFLNPPFGDVTLPTIQAISAASYSGSDIQPLTCVGAASGHIDIAMEGNTSIFVLFRATDNVRLSRLQVTVSPSGTGTPFSPTPTDISGDENDCRGFTGTYPGGTFNVTFDRSASSFAVMIVAEDASGLPVSAAVQIQT